MHYSKPIQSKKARPGKAKQSQLISSPTKQPINQARKQETAKNKQQTFQFYLKTEFILSNKIIIIKLHGVGILGSTVVVFVIVFVISMWGLLVSFFLFNSN